MLVYHGTSGATALHLSAGNVDVALGGGELGMGFYTGEYLHVAKPWAIHRYRDRQQNVVTFDVGDADVGAMDVLIFDRGEASFHRSNIKRSRRTRTYRFHCDMVWSPIVGTDKIFANQHKWESDLSQNYLNSAVCIKGIV
jgi:hypothetical protein